MEIIPQPKQVFFEHFKIEDNILPIVPTIFQDRTGYIWVGTYWGLRKYDGYSFKSYIPQKNNKTSTTDVIVQAICDDTEGNIWIGHLQGLNKLNPNSEKFTNYTLNPKMSLSDPSNNVLSLLEDKDGTLWIGTGGGLYSLIRKQKNSPGLNMIPLILIL